MDGWMVVVVWEVGQSLVVVDRKKMLYQYQKLCVFSYLTHTKRKVVCSLLVSSVACSHIHDIHVHAYSFFFPPTALFSSYYLYIALV